jgi:S1-C subfamily serine protease
VFSRRAAKLFLSVSLTSVLLALPGALGVDRQQRERALLAVVELVPLEALPAGGFSLKGYTVDGFRFVRGNGSGSGSIVSADGLILTNAHVVSGAAGASSGLAPLIEVRLTLRPDQAARPSYLARVTHLDLRLDLAALQIVADASGQPVRLRNLPAMQVGDSDDLTLGDDLAVLGYPQVGGETITYTAGRVSGFVGENLRGAGRAFIKTDAKFSSGSSGGSALDEAGHLVAIPTAIAFDRTGGVPQESQNYLRPIALALEMLKTPLPPIQSGTQPGMAKPMVCLEAAANSGLRTSHPWLFAGCRVDSRPN